MQDEIKKENFTDIIRETIKIAEEHYSGELTTWEKMKRAAHRASRDFWQGFFIAVGFSTAIRLMIDGGW